MNALEKLYKIEFAGEIESCSEGVLSYLIIQRNPLP